MKNLFLVLMVGLMAVLGAGCQFIEVVDEDGEKMATEENSVGEGAMVEDEGEAVAAESFVAGDLRFELPEDWKFQAREVKDGEEIYKIITPHKKYVVVAEMMLKKAAAKDLSEDMLIEKEGDVSVYNHACGGPFACFGVKVGEDVAYDVVFNLSSDQPVPEDLDGPWLPANNVTEDDLVKLLLSAEKV